ncbi:MAG: hypothetical protein JW895_15775 [Thermoleophilaceae bacterium]|nr:hypothetical protein [Thermoleophilaceae bacterium]
MRGIAASSAVLFAALAFAAPAGAAGPGELEFSARFDAGAGPYAAGSTPFVTVRGAGGKVVAQRRVGAGGTVISLPRGTYRVTAYWRPCEGGCDPDDLPLDHCARRVSIHTAGRGASERVVAAAVFRGGEACRMSVNSDWPPPVVVRAGRRTLNANRGPYCRPSPETCTPLPSQPSTKRRLPVRAGTVVNIDFGVPTRRLLLDGICGSGRLRYSDAGRRWSFTVPRATTSSMRTCHDIKLTVTYAGPGVRRGVRAVFGFDLRRAG